MIEMARMTAGTPLRTPIMDVARQTGSDVEGLEDAHGGNWSCALKEAVFAAPIQVFWW